MQSPQINIDKVCELILEGYTWQQIANTLGNIKEASLRYNINKDATYSARAREARTLAAAKYADMAEHVLLNAPKDPIEMQRARELAQHYRWKAGKCDPKDYGDRVQQDVVVSEITSRIID